MKNIYNGVKIIIGTIALFLFASGFALTAVGIYEFASTFSYLFDGSEHTAGLMAMGLLHAVDVFLVAIVLLVMSIGMWVLFSDPGEPLPVKIPEWLRVKSFIQLKVLLWEAVLTTLVVSFLATLFYKKMHGDSIVVTDLILPGAILLIAISLFFLKKGEEE
jgi:uncharacterized membrane protein YqhA